MERSRFSTRGGRRGAVLVLSMIFIVMLVALATAMMTMAGSNVQLASNQHHANQALSSAHSGVEVVRYYFEDICIATRTPAERLEGVAEALCRRIAGMRNIDVIYDVGMQKLIIPPVCLSEATDTSFYAVVIYGRDPDGSLNYDALQVGITGRSGQATRRVGFTYEFIEGGNPLFDYGIATKGPLLTQGSTDIDTFNESFWADVYIESFNTDLALEMIGKSAIVGQVMIANGTACFSVDSQSSVYGASGSAAKQYITCGVDACPFPLPRPAQFERYIQTTYDPATSKGLAFTNIEIPANTNPQFDGGTTINGIMYIRQPNVVTFRGNARINGIIVAEGDPAYPGSRNQIDFAGTLTGYDVSSLPPSHFGDLAQKTGTLILAPGFSVSFGGDSNLINGAVAASGVRFYGNAGGTINGSVINYSDARMELQGNTDLVFHRSGAEQMPAGFEPSTTLHFVANSYAEGLL